MSGAAPCPFCAGPGGEVLWQDSRLRVVRADEADYPGFLRVVWNAHVREMTDLSGEDRAHLMAVVWAAEGALRALLAPDKVNLASLGNQAPHLHWHIIARFADDAHFPDPVWAARRREGVRHGVAGEALATALAERLGQASS